MRNINQADWIPTFDQEGNEITPQMIYQEALSMHQAIFDEKREAFEEKLEQHCIDTDQPYRSMGFEPQVSMRVYQVGMGIHGVEVSQRGLRPVQVGVIR